MPFEKGTGEKINCTGQDCPERERCKRWQHDTNHDWASFDLERKAKGGLCPNRVDFTPARIRKGPPSCT